MTRGHHNGRASPCCATRRASPSWPIGLVAFGITATAVHPRSWLIPVLSNRPPARTTTGASSAPRARAGPTRHLAVRTTPGGSAAHHRPPRAAPPLRSSLPTRDGASLLPSRAPLLGHRLALQRRPDAGRLPRTDRRLCRQGAGIGPPLAPRVRPPSAGRRPGRGPRAGLYHTPRWARLTEAATYTHPAWKVTADRESCWTGYPTVRPWSPTYGPLSRLTPPHPGLLGDRRHGWAVARVRRGAATC